MTVGYLVSDLSAPSHTFVRREIDALRNRGVRVVAYSVQNIAPEAVHHPDQDSILGASATRYLAAMLICFWTAPVRFLQTWLEALRHRPPGLRNLVWSQFHFIEAVFLSRLMKRDGCRHLHSHFANSGATVGMLASKLAAVGWSVTLHGISETDYPAGATLRAKLLEARFVACASYFMMAQGLRIVPVSEWPKFEIIRCGLDLETLPSPELQTRRERPIRLVSVGRLSAEKGYDGLLQVLGAIRTDRQFELHIVGDGPMREQIAAAIDKDFSEVEIVLHGALLEEQTLQVIADADVLVLPSLMEGLPVVLIEARALGKPVVAPCIAGIPELVEDECTGLLFSPAHWSDLQSKLGRVIEDDDLLLRLGRGAAATFPDEFKIEVVAGKLADLFHHSIEAHSS